MKIKPEYQHIPEEIRNLEAGIEDLEQENSRLMSEGNNMQLISVNNNNIIKFRNRIQSLELTLKEVAE